MTPTPPEDSPSAPAARTAAVTALPPGAAGRRGARRRRRPTRLTRPATVWQCGGDDPRDGTARLSGWLLNAIVKIVTGYSRPGDRVLLLAPPPTPVSPVRWTRVGRGSGPHDGLHEAAWTVTRLGRGIQTRTAHHSDAITDFHHDSDPAIDPASPQSGSGPRPRVGLAHPADRAEADPDSPVAPLPPTSEPDRFDVVITTVSPDHTDWTHDIDWTGLLTPHGIAAVITHSDNTSSRLVDPTGRLVSTLREHGLGWLDQMILLETLLATERETPPAAPARHRRVHHDLLLFARPAGPSGDRDTTSGEDYRG